MKTIIEFPIYNNTYCVLADPTKRGSANDNFASIDMDMIEAFSHEAPGVTRVEITSKALLINIGYEEFKAIYANSTQTVITGYKAWAPSESRDNKESETPE